MTVLLLSTAIGLRKYRIPSDLRSQAEYRLVSTTVGDHVGILGAVVFVIASGRDDPAWVGDSQLPGDFGWVLDQVPVHMNEVGVSFWMAGMGSIQQLRQLRR